MSDTQSTTTTPATQNTANAIAELANDWPVIKQVLADYKAKGISGVSADLPQIIAEGQKDYAAISAAIPEIKAGAKTTEFWLVFGVDVLAVGYPMIFKHDLPVAGAALAAAVTSIYVAARSIFKSNASANVAAAVAAK